jgi:very-short-patch-repair endonuclease
VSGYARLVSDPSRAEDRAVVRRLARDHWVRAHGTPRVTLLAGSARARRLWTEWAELSGIDATLLDGSGDFDSTLRSAVARASTNPAQAIAVVAPQAVITGWQPVANDRMRTLAAEGMLVVDELDSVRTEPAGGRAAVGRLDARSAAEAALFEALEATAATAGRFELNGRLSVRFGGDAAEVDLLGRTDAIAIEIDGYHHFADPDCYRRDRRKDLLLQTQGLLVIRLLAEDVMRDPPGSVNVVCQALAYRRGHK